MDTLQAILLGIVQGITEFLPVSSSGHLQIAKEVLAIDPETPGVQNYPPGENDAIGDEA